MNNWQKFLAVLALMALAVTGCQTDLLTEPSGDDGGGNDAGERIEIER